MSNYPIWWDSTLTIYNRYENKVTNVVTWNRKVVHNCFWKYVGDKISVGQTILETNNIICRIPEDDSFREKYIWEQLPAYEMENFFTLGVGDIIVKGEVDDEIDEYVSGKHSNELVSKYKALQGCMTIENTAINVGPGRCNPHYYVKGV